MMKPEEFINFNVILTGVPHTGKTCLFNCIHNKDFDPEYTPTVKYKNGKIAVEFKDRVCQLSIYDTSGRKRYAGPISYWFKTANCVVITYDVTNKNSFDKIKRYVDRIKDKCLSDPLIVLCGCKADKTKNRIVSSEEGMKAAEEINAIFIETSALYKTSVYELFKMIICKLLDNF